MKNPFKKKNNSALIAGIVIGSVAAGTAAYLFLSENGVAIRQQLAARFNRFKDDLTGNKPEPVDEHHTDYLHHKQKAPKTDKKKLLKHEILSTGSTGPAEEHEGQV